MRKEAGSRGVSPLTAPWWPPWRRRLLLMAPAASGQIRCGSSSTWVALTPGFGAPLLSFASPALGVVVVASAGLTCPCSLLHFL